MGWQPARSAEVSFSRDIRPILAASCFSCHGADGSARKADLRLDQRESATAPAKGGLIAIVAGKPAESELIRRVSSTDADVQMPPPKSKKPALTARQVSLLQAWIAGGAKYESHWAFSPPTRPAIPATNELAAGDNPIDRFVVQKLADEGLSLSSPAEKATLLRRLSLDLIGLPPSPQEVDAFVADASGDAYARQVERLLASPHYGEVWGRHWLDAARYADSDGFEKDKQRFVWFYRDWVINAFNRDLPYNQFLVEQLAGDQLPHPTQDQVVATGFLRNSLLNEEGGVNPEQFRMDEMFDRMDAIGKSILGLTIQCAQCHSHKYDPISQTEYYRLLAFLNNDHEACQVVYTPEEQNRIGDLSRQMRQIEAALQQRTPDWPQQMNAWEQRVKNDQPTWTVLNIENTGDNSQHYFPQSDGSLLAQGYAPTKFTGTFAAKTSLQNIRAFRLELLTDPNLPCGGPGRSINGTGALSEFSVDVATAEDPKTLTKVKFSEASADFNQPIRDLEAIYYDKQPAKRITGPVKFAIDGDAKSAWGIDAGPGRRNVDRKAVFVCEQPISVDTGGELVIHFGLQQNHGGWNSDDNQNNNLGRFRLSATADEGPLTADPLPSRVRKILEIPLEQRSAPQVAEVFSYWRTTVPEWSQENQQIESLWKQWPAGATQLTLVAREQGRQTHVLSRGDFLKPTDAVTPGVPAFLNPLPDGAPPSRLTLARWLTDPSAPTTARVYVNRIWQAYFGTGIVSTPEDFGTQGDLPTHPQLLDWLACEFMRPSMLAGGETALAEPWNIRHIHRLIVTSRTYRQSSAASSEMLARDPYDRLLERAPRFRVDGEIIHDIVLSASGLLNDKMGGRPVMPPAPGFLFLPPSSYGPFPWINDSAPEKYRRAVYTFRRRSTPFPMLQTFDVPNGEAACIRRSRTNSPLQALVSLNEPMFVECSQALAAKVLREGGDSEDARLDYACERVLSRRPNDVERAELLGLLRKQRQRFADGWLNPSQVATGQATPPADLPPGMTPTQLAAWTVLSRVLLNLDETITRE